MTRMLYLALLVTTHWMPATTLLTVPAPFWSSTRTSDQLALRAMPRSVREHRLPLEDVPFPAMMPATWVPCPQWS